MSKTGYARRLEAVAKLLVPLLQALALAGALTALDYFNSKADLDWRTRVVAVWYDDANIRRDFNEYKVDLENFLPDRYWGILPQDTTRAFMKRIHASMELHMLNFAHDTASLNNLRDGLAFEEKEIAGTTRETPGGWTDNCYRWEKTFPDLIENQVDDTTFLQAMNIIIGNRKVKSAIVVFNDGDVAAENITLHLQAPFLLRPRRLMTQARVGYVEIEPERPATFHQSQGQYASIRIPYLRPGDVERIWVTTTMANVTRENMFVQFETDRRVNLTRATVFLGAILLLLYGLLPFVSRFLRDKAPGNP